MLIMYYFVLMRAATVIRETILTQGRSSAQEKVKKAKLSAGEWAMLLIVALLGVCLAYVAYIAAISGKYA